MREKQTMPRQLRIDFFGAIHHVMRRKNRRAKNKRANGRPLD
jgi:hypothetical protein